MEAEVKVEVKMEVAKVKRGLTDGLWHVGVEEVVGLVRVGELDRGFFVMGC